MRLHGAQSPEPSSTAPPMRKRRPFKAKRLTPRVTRFRRNRVGAHKRGNGRDIFSCNHGHLPGAIAIGLVVVALDAARSDKHGRLLRHKRRLARRAHADP